MHLLEVRISPPHCRAANSVSTAGSVSARGRGADAPPAAQTTAVHTLGVLGKHRARAAAAGPALAPPARACSRARRQLRARNRARTGSPARSGGRVGAPDGNPRSCSSSIVTRACTARPRRRRLSAAHSRTLGLAEETRGAMCAEGPLLNLNCMQEFFPGQNFSRSHEQQPRTETRNGDEAARVGGGARRAGSVLPHGPAPAACAACARTAGRWGWHQGGRRPPAAGAAPHVGQEGRRERAV